MAEENKKFKLVYDKEGTITGSYTGIPGDDDVAVIEVAVLEGEEEPTPVPTGTVSITENGIYDVAEYASAEVNVPGATTKDLFETTENGTYNIAEYARVKVDVPNPSTGVLNITQNGEFDVTEKAGVNVNVPNPSTGTLEITENGVYDVTNKASVDVSVSGVVPTGNINITTTAQTDVAAYATAQVVDANLVAGNIKSGVTILGVSGTFDNHSADLDALLQETF